MVGLPILNCWRQTEQRAGCCACEDGVLNRQLFVLERPVVFPGLYAGIRLVVFPPLMPLGGVGGLGTMVLQVRPAFVLQIYLAFFLTSGNFFVCFFWRNSSLIFVIRSICLLSFGTTAIAGP